MPLARCGTWSAAARRRCAAAAPAGAWARPLDSWRSPLGRRPLAALLGRRSCPPSPDPAGRCPELLGRRRPLPAGDWIGAEGPGGLEECWFRSGQAVSDLKMQAGRPADACRASRITCQHYLITLQEPANACLQPATSCRVLRPR